MGLYQSDWSKKPPHTHAYRAVTDVVQGHYHVIEGFSQPENGSNRDEHTHFYTGITSFENGHFHRYYGISGPAIPRVDGTHYHELSETTFAAYNEPIQIQHGGVVYDPREEGRKTHRHTLKGKTREVVGNEPIGW
ncbi:YmaF family protein [Bacillus velezensis]|uniref:YmaF family protein n=1 Tax=Bacillus velezensis TaxID=492670 RepID=UPI001C0F92D1|nr:YmaF family protein [Bacillus velezensis]